MAECPHPAQFVKEWWDDEEHGWACDICGDVITVEALEDYDARQQVHPAPVGK